MVAISNESDMVTIKQKGFQGDSIDEKYSRTTYQFRRVLTYLFQNSPVAEKEIPNTLFTYKSLIGLTVDYHNSVCKDRSCIDFTKSTTQEVYFEPYLGLTDTWLSFFSSKRNVSQTNLNAGIRLRFMPFKRLTKWNFLAGLKLSSNNFTGEFDNSIFEDGYTSLYRIHTRFMSVHLPLTFEYILGRENLQPFLSFSYDNIFVLNQGFSIWRIDPPFNFEAPSGFRVYHFGLSAGAGLRMKLKEHSYLFVKTEYEYRRPVERLNYILDYENFQSLQLSIGVGFKI
jgi:hypothetical protein